MHTDEKTGVRGPGPLDLSGSSLRDLLAASGWTAEASSTLGHSLAVRAGVTPRKGEPTKSFNSAL